MAIRVERPGQTVAGIRLVQGEEVPGGILGRPEGGPGDRARGVVDRPHQGGVGLVRPEPLMARAVGLQEHPGARHALAPRAVLGRAVDPRGWQSGLAEDPAQRAHGDGNLLSLGQELGEMRPVHPGVRGSSQGHQALAEGSVGPVGRPATGVAVPQGIWALVLEGSQ